MEETPLMSFLHSPIVGANEYGGGDDDGDTDDGDGDGDGDGVGDGDDGDGGDDNHCAGSDSDIS